MGGSDQGIDTSDVKLLRSDAQRNRTRILQAAAAAFAELGPSVSLVEIARRAGVGNATLHRNFSKEQLVDEVFSAWFEQRLATAERALADPDVWHGFAAFCEGILTVEGGHRSMGSLFAIRPHWRDRFIALTGDLLARVREHGDIRADLTVEDLALGLMSIATTMSLTADVAPNQWRRQLAILLAGMRATSERLPGLPVTGEQLNSELTQWSAAMLRVQ